MKTLTRGMLVGLSVLCTAAASRGIEGDWTTYVNANDVRGLAEDLDGIWCATGGGVLHYDEDDGRLRLISRSADGLSSDSLTAVIATPDGRLAFGTGQVGVAFYDPDLGLWYEETSLTWPLGSDEVLSMRQADPWQIIGSKGGFVARRDGEVKRVCQQGLDVCGLPGWDVQAGLYHDGYLWFGTTPGEEALGGVGRLNFDNAGGPLGVWDTLNTGLPDNSVTDFALWEGELFCSVKTGIVVWDGSQWLTRRRGIPTGTTVTDLLAGENDLYAAVCGYKAPGGTYYPGGVYRWDGEAESWSQVGEFSAGEVYVRCLLEAHGTLWAGTSDQYSGKNYLRSTEEGLWELVGESWRQHRYDSPHSVSYYWAISADPAGRVYAAAAMPGRWHIARFDPQASQRWEILTSSNTDMTDAWAQDIRIRGERVWIGRCCCRAGQNCYLDVWNPETGEVETHQDLFNIWDSTEDQWGNFWFGSYHETSDDNPDAVRGLFHWRSGAEPEDIVQYTVESTGNEMRSNAVSALAAEGKSIWIGYPGHGLSRLRLSDDGQEPWPYGNPWTHYDATDEDSPLIGNQIRALAAREGEVWIGTDNGLSIRESGQWTSLTESSGLPGSQIVAIALTEDAAAWVGISGEGVTRISQDQFGAYEFETFTEPYVVNRYPAALTPGAEGSDLWVATQWGLSHFVPRASLAAEHQEGLPIYPNPFNPECGQAAAFVKLPGQVNHGVVVDTNGRVMATLDRIGAQEPFTFWDGRDLDGEIVAPGLYLVRVATAQGWLTGQVAVIDLPCDAGY